MKKKIKLNKKISKNNSIYYLTNSNLNLLNKKYCSCLMKVRKTQPNPYGICTNAIYKSKKSIKNRPIDCVKHYNFETYDVKTLKAFAEKKIKGFSKMNRKDLLKSLKDIKEKNLILTLI